jgi:hypothetical protein
MIADAKVIGFTRSQSLAGPTVSIYLEPRKTARTSTTTTIAMQYAAASASATISPIAAMASRAQR